MNLSRYEQETIITFNEADSAAEIFTYNGRLPVWVILTATKCFQRATNLQPPTA